MLTELAFLWLLTAVAGYGFAFWLIWRWCTGTTGPFVSIGDVGLAGLLVLAAFGILLHFFISLSPELALALNLVGLILFVVLGRSRLAHHDMINWLFLFLCVLTFGLQAKLDRPNPDAGIYYIPSIHWNSAAPIIPGLANVHGRLGYNNAGLVLATLLRLPIILWKGAFLLNALFALFVMMAFFERLRTSLAASGVTRISTLYCLLMIGGFAAKNFVFNGNLGSLSTDFGPFLLACYIGFLLLLFAENRDPSLAGWSTLLATFAVLLKLSAFPLLCGSLLVLLLSRGALSTWRHTTLATLSLMLGLFGSLAVRGLLLSGCAAYPMLATCVSQLPWMVPAELAKNETQYVLDYARGTIEDPRSIVDWLSPVGHELLKNHTGRFLLLLSGTGLILMIAGRFRSKREKGSHLRPGLAPICIGLAWLLFAVLKGPALRFYSGGAFLFAYTVAALGVFQFSDILASLALKRWVPGALCLLLTIQGGVLAIKYFEATPKDWPHFETPIVLQRKTDSGFLIWVSQDEYCWDAPLPCTPYFDQALQPVRWLNRFYFVGQNTVAYRNGFPPRMKNSEAK
jgi:hypothetical protein